jgi:hypothetical protein
VKKAGALSTFYAPLLWEKRSPGMVISMLFGMHEKAWLWPMPNPAPGHPGPEFLESVFVPL